jgi:hypothetical protein
MLSSGVMRLRLPGAGIRRLGPARVDGHVFVDRILVFKSG